LFWESSATELGKSSAASTAGPPVPPKPCSPLPATVVMMPFETFRMRLLNLSGR